MHIFATHLLIQSASYFSILFQKFDDLLHLALLDTDCAISVFPSATKQDKRLYKEAKVCDALYQLAAKDYENNLCLLFLECLIPKDNISQEEFDKLYSIMIKNPSIEANRLEAWKNSYNKQDSSYLLSFGFFSLGSDIVATTMKTASEFIFKPK
jgi:hypothetical protein